ncbi:MAG: YetF domain-containing protein [Chitinophagaceae bacterium]
MGCFKKSNLSQQDLMQTLRLNARISDVNKVKVARLERNVDISIILKDNEE